MHRTPTVAAVREDLARLGCSGLDWRSFSLGALGRLTKAIGAEASCVATADPSTLLMTGVVASDHPDSGPRFFELEYGTDDFLSQRDLARGTAHAGALSRATEGRLDRSVRWRELLQPHGLGDQLRAALVSSERCWGYLALIRERSSGPFADADVRLVSRLLRVLAEGLRRSNAIETARGGERPDAPGLAVLAEDLSVLEATPVAERLLEEELAPGSSAPAALLGVAASAKAALASDGAGGAPVGARVNRTGGWLSVTASPLLNDGQPLRIAVIVQPAAAGDTVDLMLDAYGLTPREAEITRAILAGRSTEEIARELYISPLTVQQHLKSIFDKLGVRSRRELVSLIFHDRYLAEFASR